MSPDDAPGIIAKTEGAVPYYVEKGQAHPRAVHGLFRRIKWLVSLGLIAWWHLAPLMRWDRGPGMPDQAILIDMTGRRAYFFFIEIWPQEVYYLTGLLLIAAIALFLMSAVAGRLWCGYLCWQTVYTDLFVEMERLILGDRARRLALDQAPLSLGKLARHGLVKVSWLLIAAACGISFVLYFGDAFTMAREIFTGQASATTYQAILIVGGMCFLLAGFARERVCVYMCPYSRFQAAMVDEHSLIVTYDVPRGEPRGPLDPAKGFTERGHCVDCRMCVVSCPTGIDIRHGNQLACIGCGLCVDACNAVMDRFHLPRGLVSYVSEYDLLRRTEGLPPSSRIIRPRTLIYTAILFLVASAILVALTTRATTKVNLLHERAPLFVELSGGAIRNGYTYKILNMTSQERSYILELDGLADTRFDVVGGAHQTTSTRLTVDRNAVGTFRLYVTAPASALKSSADSITFVLKAEDDPTHPIRSETLFAGP